MNQNKFFYTHDHEWINIKENNAVIGITDYAQNELGDIIFIELPSIGDSFDKGEVFGTIEAVKTVADLYMPISGEIVELNSEIESNPELINNNPFNKGWIVRIKIKNKEECLKLLNQKEYSKIIND